MTGWVFATHRPDFVIRDTPVYAEVFPFLGFFAAAGLTASSSAVIVANITVFNEQSSRRTFLSICLDSGCIALNATSQGSSLKGGWGRGRARGGQKKGNAKRALYQLS